MPLNECFPLAAHGALLELDLVVVVALPFGSRSIVRRVVRSVWQLVAVPAGPAARRIAHELFGFSVDLPARSDAPVVGDEKRLVTFLVASRSCGVELVAQPVSFREQRGGPRRKNG
ncbi:MAG: hypothetical protein ACRDNM_00810 [Gaiellaceae bacterium]